MKITFKQCPRKIRALITEGILCRSHSCQNSTLATDMVDEWGKTHDGFGASLTEALERQKCTRFCLFMAIGLAVLFTLTLFTKSPYNPTHFKEGQWLIILALGWYLGGWLRGRPYRVHIVRLDDLVSAVYTVLLAVNQHVHGPILNNDDQHTAVRKMLEKVSFSQLQQPVDNLMVEQALLVKLAEAHPNPNDPSSQGRRDSMEAIRYPAYWLGLAEKNPQTYFDRAVIPLSTSPAAKPTTA